MEHFAKNQLIRLRILGEGGLGSPILVVRRTNNRKAVGSMLANVVCITVGR